MIRLEIEKIQEHLRRKGLEAQLQKETQQLYLIFKIAEREFPLFIRVFEGGELLQLLAFLPCNTKANTLGDTARLLHLLNKELDIPGFGMDESSSVVFYRCMLPAPKKQLEETLFDAFLNSIQLVCKSFAPVIATVAYGGATFDEIIKKTQEQGKKPLSQSQLQTDE